MYQCYRQQFIYHIFANIGPQNLCGHIETHETHCHSVQSRNLSHGVNWAQATSDKGSNREIGVNIN